MKKYLLLPLLLIALLASGCAEKAQVSQVVSVTEAVEPEYDSGALADYMASVEEQAAAVEDFLTHDAMTQAEMNLKSHELYQIWDDALNYLWGELKHNLPEDEFAVLLEEQRAWIAEKEAAVEEAGREYEGGTIYSLIVNSTAAEITEERVYELYERILERE